MGKHLVRTCDSCGVTNDAVMVGHCQVIWRENSRKPAISRMLGVDLCRVCLDIKYPARRKAREVPHG